MWEGVLEAQSPLRVCLLPCSGAQDPSVVWVICDVVEVTLDWFLEGPAAGSAPHLQTYDVFELRGRLLCDGDIWGSTGHPVLQ